MMKVAKKIGISRESQMVRENKRLKNWERAHDLHILFGSVQLTDKNLNTKRVYAKFVPPTLISN